MKYKISLNVIVILILTLVCSSIVFAFQDLPESTESSKIRSLKESNIIQGKSESIFAPNEELTFAQAIQLSVQGFDLSLAHIQFIRAPSASDYYEHVPDSAWYAEAFIIAHHNGLEVPRDVDPNKSISREEFVHLFYQAMQVNDDFSIIEIWVQIADEKDINTQYMNSIQSMIILNIVALDENQLFHPLNSITRFEAAVLLYDVRAFVEKNGIEPGSEPGVDLPESVDEDVSMTIEKVSEEIYKIVVDWGEQPNSGYGITIDSIDFDHKSGTAIVNYKLHHPDPDKMYLQVITYPKAETYISSDYKVSIKHAK